MQADKFLQEIKNKKLALEIWRPYKVKNNIAPLAKGLITATAGAALSYAQSYQGLATICSIVALCEIYKVWKNNKKDKDHQVLLNNIAVNMSHIYENEEDSARKQKYAYMCMNSDIVRKEFSDIIKTSKIHSSKNKNNIWEHNIECLISTPLDSKIKVTTLVACMRTALTAAAQGHPQSSAIIHYNRINKKEQCIITFMDLDNNTEDPLILKKFAHYINFMFNDDLLIKDLRFSRSNTNIQMLEELIIDSPGEWLLENGHILEVVPSAKNNKSFEVSVYVPQTGIRGMVIEHKGLESINKTWSHLVAHIYEPGKTPSI